MNIQVLATTDDLSTVCQQMQPEVWGADNEMTSYQPESPRKFLESGGLLVLARDGEKIAGVVLCYVLPHPDGADTLYVHELDTHPDYRRQGVATQLMQKAVEIAKEKGLREVWLCADADNEAANKLYQSISPTEVESTLTFTYGKIEAWKSM